MVNHSRRSCMTTWLQVQGSVVPRVVGTGTGFDPGWSCSGGVVWVETVGPGGGLIRLGVAVCVLDRGELNPVPLC